MIIQNYDELDKKHNRLALKILESGFQAADPKNNIDKLFANGCIKAGKQTFDLSKYDNLYVVAFGKAADSMAKTVDSNLKITNGIIVIPEGSKSVFMSKRYQIINSGHPTPNQNSVRAAKSILKLLENRRKNDFVIFLISGGGSALVSLPDKITLGEKIHVTNYLLKSGATIQEINRVRKHLSKIKGGKLIQNLSCDWVSLIMSDVADDDLSSISSGCTVYDTTTPKDALDVLKKYQLQSKVPERVLEKLNEKTKSSNADQTQTKNFIIATNDDCIKAMSDAAKKSGLHVNVIPRLSGDIKDVTSTIISLIPNEKKNCIIFGGEPTVNVIGKGKGGRNQELVLRLLKQSQKLKQKIVFASVGTDGIDGNTKHAGAITDNFKIDPETIKSFLKDNNSNGFFEKHGGLIKTGYTHTNLMDIGLIVT